MSYGITDPSQIPAHLLAGLCILLFVTGTRIMAVCIFAKSMPRKTETAMGIFLLVFSGVFLKMSWG